MKDSLTLKLTYTEPQLNFLYGSEDKFKVITKGRRAGVTYAFKNGFIEWMLEGVSPLLWVDTVNSNIQRYMERYFEPTLKQSGIPFEWHKTEKVLKIYNSVCDFRSADRPENIEGFGYKKIFLNEAGIILKSSYLFSNTILPMLMDYPEAQLIAAGVPKGKELRHGGEHPFYTLTKRAISKAKGYRYYNYSSYDNTTLNKEDIKQLEDEIVAMSPQMVEQEIYGKFIDVGGNNPFAYAYDIAKHESDVQFDPNKKLYISVDWNLNPFCCNVWHKWRDADGFHFHCVDEISLNNSSIPDMADRLKQKYNNLLNNAIFTGDSMGKQRDIARRDNLSNWKVLKNELERTNGIKLRTLNWKHQFQLPHNPSHENSRADVNYVLTHFPDFKISNTNCPNTCRDMRLVQCDSFGGIVKRNRNVIVQQSDMLDCVRYSVNTWLFDWLKLRRK